MSTFYITRPKVSASDLFDGRLEKFGVREHIEKDETTKTERCLTDGRNCLWVYINDAGLVGRLSRHGINVPGTIMNAIAEESKTDFFSEHEPQYWGFDTREEWAAAWTIVEHSPDIECEPPF